MARSEKMTSVIPFRLKYAREYYGLSLEEASRRAGLEPDELASFENGSKFPTYSKLGKLSELYNRPLLFFFFRSEPHEDQLLVEFRSSEQNGHPLEMQIRVMMEKADWYRLQLKELCSEDTEIDRFFTLLQQDKIETSQKLIQWLRNRLDLSLEKQKSYKKPNDLLNYLRDKLYEIGIYVFKDSFKMDDVSGLCLYDEEYPVILLNNKMTFTRQIFTLFHELYHLYTKKTDVCYTKYEEEKACDQFASEFLVPETDFQTRLANITEFESHNLIEILANEYKVSQTAIAYRLMKLDKISATFYVDIQKDGIDSIRKAKTASAAGNFYYTRISYLGTPYLNSVFKKYYTGEISIAKVGRYTGLKVSHVSRMLSSNMLGGIRS